MSKQINPAKLGIFVLVAIGLGLGTLAVLSSGSLFKKTLDYVMVFDGDARGLKTGAPVLLKGVAVGQVSNIQLVVDATKNKTLVPVTVKLDPSRLIYIGELELEKSIQKAIDEGLRGQLQTQSFVTGMLEINLVRMPDSPANFHAEGYDLPEIPTLPPLTQILANEIKDLNLQEMLEDIRDTLDAAQTLTRKTRESQLVEKMAGTLAEMNALTQGLNRELPLLSKEILETTTSIRELSEQGKKVLTHTETMMAELEKSAPGLLKGAEGNTEKFLELQTALTHTLKEAEGVFAQDSPLRFHLANLLNRYSKVAVKMEMLLDTLENNPESILTGKPE